MKHAMPARVKRGLSILLVLTMLFALLTPVSAAAANTAEQTVELQVGESETLRLSGWAFRTTWSSSDEAVATVSSRGVVTAMAPGNATITAVSRGIFGFGASTRSFAVVVTEAEVPGAPEEPEEPEVPETPEEQEPLTVKVNETLELSVDANGGQVTWNSSDETIATVDGDGVVTGVSEGEVTITATVKKTTGRFWFFWWGGTTTTTTTEFAVSVLPADDEPADPSEPDEPVNPDEPELEGTYTVTFNTNGGSEIEAQTVLTGECAIQPENPAKEGYVFEGWYADEALNEKYDFSQPVEGNITVYAGWTAMTTRIELNDGGYGIWVVNRTITGSVASNADIEEITYKLTNGETEIASDTIELEEDGGFAVSVLLQDGTNTLTVSVKTADGTTTDESVELIYDSGEVFLYKLPAESVHWYQLTEEEADAGEAVVDSAADVVEGDDEILGEEEENEEETLPEPEKWNESDKESAKYLVTNVLSLYFYDTIPFEAREAFITDTLGGEVAGYLNGLGMMQILLKDTLPAVDGYTGTTNLDPEKETAVVTERELWAYGEALQQQYPDILEFVEVEHLYENIEMAVTTNDPWDPNTDSSSNDDWWLDMINAYDAWEYNEHNNMEYFESITLGAIDTGFDQNHVDLSPYLTVVSKENSPGIGHGTHVSGIMVANADNGKGIAGVMYDNAVLLGYDVQGTFLGMTYAGDSAVKSGLTKLVESGAKVINVSMGANAPKSGKFTISDSDIKDYGKTYSKYMGKLLEKGYDFIVVQSAGNGNADDIGFNYWHNGMFCSINKDNCYSSSSVSKNDIMSRILVVSNVDSNKKMTQDSNGGSGELHIVAAPGKCIYSTLNNNDYGWHGGTSMAAPVASGVCGLVWSANPWLSGDEVIDVVVNNTVGTAKTNNKSKTTGGMGVVNALAAVEASIAKLPSYTGRITDATTGNGIANAKITLLYYKNGHNGIYAGDYTADASGNFTLKNLPLGVFELRITANGYEDARYTFGANRHGTNFNLGGIAMTPKLNADEYRIILTWNDKVSDLDSHLLAETKSGETIHLYYATMHDNITQAANLDVDDTDYYGPETITITNISALKNIRYAVHDFSNHSSTSSKAMSGTEATVKVYKGSTLLNTFQISTNKGGTEWDVFAIDASGKIVPTNRMTYCTDPTAVLSGAASASVASASAAAAGRAIVKK